MLTKMCSDICHKMEYFTQIKFVHQDQLTPCIKTYLDQVLINI